MTVTNDRNEIRRATQQRIREALVPMVPTVGGSVAVVVLGWLAGRALGCPRLFDTSHRRSPVGGSAAVVRYLSPGSPAAKSV